MNALGRRLSDRDAPLIGLAGVIVIVCWTLTISHGVSDPGYAVVYGLLIAFGEVLRVRGGGSWHALAPLSVASGLAYGLTMVTLTPEPMLIPIAEVLAVVGLGQVVGVLVYAAGRRTPEIACVSIRTVIIAFAAGAAHLFVGVRWLHELLARVPQIWLAVALICSLGSVALMLALLAAIAPNRYGTPWWGRAADEFTVHGLTVAATASTASVMALGAWELGPWAGPLFLLPLVLTVVAIGHSAVVRRKQAQTIRALSRAAEIAGYTEVGHSDRVTRLALAVGAELRLRRPRMQRVETAALIHDVGQLSLTERIPFGDAMQVTAEQRVEIARRGAEVIRQTGAMAEVADVVEEGAVPFAESEAVPAIRRDAQIVAVANAYDDLLVGDVSFARRRQAVEWLRAASGTDYDPVVVEALARVVDSVDTADLVPTGPGTDQSGRTDARR